MVSVEDERREWVGGGGWIREMGVMEWAGGIVENIKEGVDELEEEKVMGNRRG